MDKKQFVVFRNINKPQQKYPHSINLTIPIYCDIKLNNTYLL